MAPTKIIEVRSKRWEDLAGHELAVASCGISKNLNLPQGRHRRMLLSGVQSEHLPWIPAKSMRE